MFGLITATETLSKMVNKIPLFASRTFSSLLSVVRRSQYKAQDGHHELRILLPLARKAGITEIFLCAFTNSPGSIHMAKSIWVLTDVCACLLSGYYQMYPLLRRLFPSELPWYLC